MEISFAGSAWDDFLAWVEQDRKTYRRIKALLKEIQRTPFEGTGKPEPLRGDYSGYWSRRIDRGNRLVYRVEPTRIVVVQCRGHYADR